MIRLIADKAGEGHNDLFLKIDVLPSYLQVADSYYLADFLEVKSGEELTVPYLAAELLRCWEQLIAEAGTTEPVFLPFDLCDEYVGGFLLKVAKRSFNIQRVSGTQLHGYEITRSLLEPLLRKRQVVFDAEQGKEWLITGAQLQQGFAWSYAELGY